MHPSVFPDLAPVSPFIQTSLLAPPSFPLPGSQARAIQEAGEAESYESTAARIQLDIAMQAPLIAVLLEEGSKGVGVGLRSEGWGQLTAVGPTCEGYRGPEVRWWI